MKVVSQTLVLDRMEGLCSRLEGLLIRLEGQLHPPEMDAYLKDASERAEKYVQRRKAELQGIGGSVEPAD